MFVSAIICILIAIGVVITAVAIWVKTSIWIMGLGVTDDNQIDWPWRKDD